MALIGGLLFLTAYFRLNGTTFQTVGKADTNGVSSVSPGVSARLASYLRLVQDPRTTIDNLEMALTNIASLPVEEPPEFWVKIVNGTNYTDDCRRDCIVVFFRRHIHAGTRLNWFHRVAGISNWFNESNILPASAAEMLPIKDRGKIAYMYQPEVFRSENSYRYQKGGLGAVYFSLNQSVALKRFLRIMGGKEDDGGCIIVEIKSTPGDVRGDPSYPGYHGQAKGALF
jgi:hypothetical protein